MHNHYGEIMVEVVVVDDSQFMRVQIREILEEGGHEVVAEAENGVRAIEAVSEHDPDVVTMDVKMPGMDGIETVDELMAEHPTPVLMLSRYTEKGAETTLKALDAGAVDFMMKPDGEVTTGLVAYADDLVELVAVVSQADVTPEQIDTGSDTPDPEPPAALKRTQWETPPTVVIAASTGGPSEIHEVMESLPSTVGLRVLIVQHMPEQFTGRFASRLNEISSFDVREGSDTDRVGPNEAVIARGNTHLEVDRDLGGDLVLSSTDAPPVHSVRPAADITLETAARAVSGPLVAVVLSGMGRDGSAGVERVAEAGGSVLTQSPESASISSMPDNAIESGVVDAVVPTAEIPETILDMLETDV